MGAAPPPSLFRRVRESHLVVVTLLAIWLVTLLQYLVPMILLLPIALVPFIGKTLYRHVTGIYDGIARLSTLVPVFSWCGLQVAVHGYSNFVELKSRGNAVMLSTHCSRVDWLIGLFLGSVGEHWSRIGFVAEATTALMPIIGWSRLLFGDIFVTRAFHKDGPRIENNIDTFHRSGVDRLIFLAPEGFIADPGTSIGEAYIEDCDVFMNKIGRVRERLPSRSTHLPTHRPIDPSCAHRSLAWLRAAAHDTPAYAPVQGHAILREARAEKRGLVLHGLCHRTPRHRPGHGHCAWRRQPDATAALGGAERPGPAHRLQGRRTRASSEPSHSLAPTPTRALTPRMRDCGAHSSAQLGVFISYHFLDFSKPSEADHIRDVLINDQQHKDECLRCFDETRRYPGMAKGDSWDVIQPPHVLLHAVLFGHTFITLTIWNVCFGVSYAAGVMRFVYAVAFIVATHSVSHFIATVATDGHSRESLVGETAVKAFLSLCNAAIRPIVRAISGKKRRPPSTDVPEAAPAAPTGEPPRKQTSPAKTKPPRTSPPRSRESAEADKEVQMLRPPPVTPPRATVDDDSPNTVGSELRPPLSPTEWMGRGGDPHRHEKVLTENLAQGLVEASHSLARDVHNGGGNVEMPYLAGAISSVGDGMRRRDMLTTSPLKPKSPPTSPSKPPSGGKAKAKAKAN